MLVQPIEQARQSAHVVVLGNEKGGSGKSTTALHIAVALLNALRVPLSENGKRRAAARAEWLSVMDQPLQVHDIIG